MNQLRSGVASGARVITPSNATNFPEGKASGGLYIGGAGNVSVETSSGTCVFTAVAAGTRLPIAATRVNATGTTATPIVALF